MIVVLEGSGVLRQGDTYTPIESGEGIFVPVGEVHGTVNDSGPPARLISFQSPPDPALYAGKRDHGAGASPLPPAGHRSEARILTLAKGGPALGEPGDWRCIVSAGQGARHLGLDYMRLSAREELSHTAPSAEEVFVVLTGSATVQADGERLPLARHGVASLQHGDRLVLRTGAEPITLIRCNALSDDC